MSSIEDGRNRPLRPRGGLPFDTIDCGGQTPHGGFICRPCRLRPGEIVQLRDAMRGDGGHHRRRRELRDRDVIGMSVCAVRSEGDHDVWTDAYELRDDARYYVAWIDTIELGIVKVEDRGVMDAKRRGGGAQLLLPDAGERGGPGMPRVARGEASKPTALTPRGRDHGDRDAFGRVLCQRSPEAKRLVIGMRKHRHQPPRAAAHRTITVSRYSDGTTSPADRLVFADRSRSTRSCSRA